MPAEGGAATASILTHRTAGLTRPAWAAGAAHLSLLNCVALLVCHCRRVFLADLLAWAAWGLLLYQLATTLVMAPVFNLAWPSWPGSPAGGNRA